MAIVVIDVSIPPLFSGWWLSLDADHHQIAVFAINSFAAPRWDTHEPMFTEAVMWLTENKIAFQVYYVEVAT